MPEQYEISWITDNLAMGHAPMCYPDLDSMRRQGITAIVNLCGEFCDLHEIQEKQGFEVYYLPIFDEEAPSESDLEKALEWLDEAIYLGKKVLVHCRHGIGRTGTFVTAYLLRKGFSLKAARKTVEKARAVHSTFSQWRLLKRYTKKAGTLTIREPSLEGKRMVDLTPYFTDYELVLARVDDLFEDWARNVEELPSCGLETDGCCYDFLELSLIEAAYLSHHLNRTLTSDERKEAIKRALQVRKRIREIESSPALDGFYGQEEAERLKASYRESGILCPLNRKSQCIMYPFRPLACRLYGLPGRRGGPASSFAGSEIKIREVRATIEKMQNLLARISANMLHALSSSFPGNGALRFTLADTVSGRFVQQYFQFLANSQNLSAM